jgi:general secretion pathway protein K
MAISSPSAKGRLLPRHHRGQGLRRRGTPRFARFPGSAKERAFPAPPYGRGTPQTEAARGALSCAFLKSSRGSALLAVMWLSAALAAIAFSLANTVRGETERVSTAVDGLRTHYLAVGAVRRAILYMDWARQHPSYIQYKPVGPFYQFDFPEGQARVELIPETAKFNINTSKPEDLTALLVNLNVPPGQASDIVAAIMDWRNPAPNGGPFDGFYASLQPPYRAAHGPFGEVEELLAVRGVTPDLFYGSWEPGPEGAQQRLYPRTGLRDCVSVFGATDRFDANTAPPAVLAAVGVPPNGVQAIVHQRSVTPFLQPSDLAPFAQVAGPGFPRLTVGGHSIFTVRATARLRLPNGRFSDMQRTVSAQVKLMPPGYDAPYHILRWYDAATGPQN